MKVLLIHNFLQSASPSGEDIAFENERDLLRKHGVEVITYKRGNDEILSYGVIEKLKLPFNSIWSSRTYREVKDLVKRERPDICHVHNIHFLVSPSAYYGCRESGIPVVQTLHNFRMFCANGLLYRDSGVCEECLGKTPIRGFFHGCFRDSRLYTLPVSVMISYHNLLGTWKKCIDAYIALTDFGKQKFVAAGLPEEKIHVKPNFLDMPLTPDFLSDGYGLYAGRVAEEKGVGILLEAWTNVGDFPLKIVGEGPFMNGLYDYVKKHTMKNVEVVGRMSHNSVLDYMKRARFCIVPSVMYEGFPMSLVEAYACGKPVVASRQGAMGEIVNEGETGLLFESGNAEDLAEKARFFIENNEEAAQMGMRARDLFEARYSAKHNFARLMDIYRKAME
jgi:glycosyltransferase involved in cell wall biosynthesis